MKERQIPFSAPMVRAILDGRKTQTRRIMKPQPDYAIPFLDVDGVRRDLPYRILPGKLAVLLRCPYGVPGDRLWVRETWCLASDDYDGNDPPFDGRPVGPADEGVYYRATEPDVEGVDGKGCWRPSIHMPRWASRILLEITDVRVERLQDISEEDAKAEGALQRRIESEARGSTTTDDVPKARAEFRRLWDHINGPGAWAANPWVWVLPFARVKP